MPPGHSVSQQLASPSEKKRNPTSRLKKEAKKKVKQLEIRGEEDKKKIDQLERKGVSDGNKIQNLKDEKKDLHKQLRAEKRASNTLIANAMVDARRMMEEAIDLTNQADEMRWQAEEEATKQAYVRTKRVLK